MWGSDALKEQYGYRTTYPNPDDPGITIDLAEL
jgi:hypothetical protein